jgi:DNA primase
MQDAKEEVRSRLNIEDVVGEYVQLKRAGRNFKGLSPFSSEKTPSFTVSPEKHIWHDFSSGKGGDIFSFVMEVEGLDFRAALELLARKAGVDLSQYDNKAAGEIAQKKKRLAEANELAARYYQQSLLRNQHALEYVFKKRGLSKEVIQEFRIGYAPDEGEALVRALVKRGFTKKELSDAGLTNRFGGDIFRARMTVPLMDGSGQVIGFTGRIISDDPNAPKYLNTPQTLLYDKSRHVFGLSQAKESIRKSDNAVVVEGNLDVISSHQAGVKHVVATAGTAMTEWHLKALSRLSQNVKLAFDADKAGLAATERAISIAQHVGAELKIVSLPESAKDPDELIQQDVNLWVKAIVAAQPVVDWVLEQYSKREDLSTAAGKRQFTTAALSVIRSLGDVVEVEHYLKQIAAMTDSSLDTIKKKFNGEEVKEARPLKQIRSSDPSLPYENFNSYQDTLLAVLWCDKKSRRLLDGFDTSLFTGSSRQQLARALQLGTLDNLQSIETYVKIVELKAESRYESWTEHDRELEAARLLRQISIEQKLHTKETLLEELRQVESDGDDQRASELRTKLHQLIKETGRG